MQCATNLSEVYQKIYTFCKFKVIQNNLTVNFQAKPGTSKTVDGLQRDRNDVAYSKINKAFNGDHEKSADRDYNGPAAVNRAPQSPDNALDASGYSVVGDQHDDSTDATSADNGVKREPSYRLAVVVIAMDVIVLFRLKHGY